MASVTRLAGVAKRRFGRPALCSIANPSGWGGSRVKQPPTWPIALLKSSIILSRQEAKIGKPKAPQAPNPTATAAAQTGSNVATALAQQQLNAVDQVGPQGSVKYSQNGTYQFTDPSSGQTYTLPKMTQTTSLSPGQQQLYDTGQVTQQNLANVGKQQSGRIGELLNTPFSLDNDATESRINELASKRLDPMLDRRRESEATRLSNQGIKIGSTAYDRAMEGVNQGENDARNQLLLNGRSQSVQEALMARNQPINEIIGLASGTQVQNPQYTAAPQTGMAGTDIAGINQGAQNTAQQQYAQQMSQYNSTAGGLFGLGASALMAFSDQRLKTDIEPTGETVAGVPVKSWTWKGTGERDTGVIAQDLEKKHPELVDKTHPSGYRRVNYGGLMQLGASARRAA